MKIIIVEDESLSALFIKEVCNKYGYSDVEIFNTASACIEYVKTGGADLIFMDINLDGNLDGIQCMQSLLKFCDASFVYISSYRDEQTLSMAINSYTLGYLVKPIYEFNIRIMLLLASKQRSKQESVAKKYIHFAQVYYFNCEDNELYKDEIKLSLTQQELKTLKILLLSQQNSISIEEIAAQLYKDDTDSATIRNLIRRLRQKLPDCIENIRGVGYVIADKQIHYG